MNDEIFTQSLDNITVRIRDHHDFSFLKQLGQVFRVFDAQDSGNICFGVDTGTEKLFVKYAGAQTINYQGQPADAIDRLTQAMPVYNACRHPNLVELREHFPLRAGYAAIFSWFPGESLHGFRAMTPEQHDVPTFRHRQLPLAQRLDSLEDIFAFHEHVARQGYVAIDFYDASLLYDFTRMRTMICDIDAYAPRPYTNTMGRMWGSSRFMSPEELELGAAIDEVSNVFTMGATAFVLLGGGSDRSLEKWEGNAAKFNVARKAADLDRNQRYPSIAAFRQAWHAAKG